LFWWDIFLCCLSNLQKRNLLKICCAIILSGIFTDDGSAGGQVWVQTGHFPYWGVYEVFSSYAWGALLFYLLVQFRKPNLKIAGIIVLPAVMLMIGVAVMSSADMKEIPKTFFTYWLWIHILFAKLSYGSVLISAALVNLSDQEQTGNKW